VFPLPKRSRAVLLLLETHACTALQQIAWCLLQQSEDTREKRRNRDAVVGLADALEKVLRYPDE
jgi:hypothetical protein